MLSVILNRKPFDKWVDNFISELPDLIKEDLNQIDRRNFVPVNVKESEKDFRLELVAPGFEKSDFEITLDQDLLTISAEKKETTANESGSRPIRREYNTRSFKRTFTLDEKIDATNIAASYINGVLILNLPKKEVVKVSATTIAVH